MLRVTLKQLEVFAAIAQAGSVLKAAERVGLTQSASSMALADLERQLGCLLFDRIGRRLRLNDRGGVILSAAMDVLARTQALERLATSEDPSAGQLQISASQTIGTSLLPALMGSYMRQYPQARLKLSIDNTRGVIEALEKFQVDLGFIEGYCHSTELEAIPWRQDELVVFVGAGHPMASRSSINLEELATLDWVLRESGSGTREVFNNAVVGKLPGIRLALELSHTEAIKQIVQNGFGAGCLSLHSVQAECQRKELHRLHTPGLNLHRQLLLLIHRQKYQSALFNGFLEYCRTAN